MLITLLFIMQYVLHYGNHWQLNYNNFVGYYYVPNEGLLVASGNLPYEVQESPKMREDRLFQELLGTPNGIGFLPEPM